MALSTTPSLSEPRASHLAMRVMPCNIVCGPAACAESGPPICTRHNNDFRTTEIPNKSSRPETNANRNANKLLKHKHLRTTIPHHYRIGQPYGYSSPPPGRTPLSTCPIMPTMHRRLGLDCPTSQRTQNHHEHHQHILVVCHINLAQNLQSH
jgi:hypothetical protein